VKSGMNLGEEAVGVSPNLFKTLSIAAKIPNTDRKVAGFELLPSAVERLARAAQEAVSTHGCYVLSQYFTTAYVPHQFINYQSRGVYVLEDGKATAVVAAVPLKGGAGCAPVSSHNNEARAIKARVVDVSNKEEFAEDLVQFGIEFSELVVPTPHKGVPWDMAELREKQDKPAQRARRLKEEQHLPDLREKLHTTSFQKRETYPKVGDPRLINQVPTDHTNRLCSYSGAMKAALKGPNRRWYMVGKTPGQVASGLKGLHKAAGELVGGDYSRMDGRTSVSYRRYVLRPTYLRYFAEPYHQELEALLVKEEQAHTTTRQFGERAAMGGANLSGSGITTDLNTLDAAFNEYAARRRDGSSPSEAFGKLGCYFGDDSVVDASIFDKVRAVATECGMKLEREPVPDGAGPGHVVFLSRVYPDIRSSPVSHPMVERSLKKLCTVQADPSAAPKLVALKLRLKVRGLLVTDSHVPVLSDYAQAIERVYGLAALDGSPEWDAACAADRSLQHKIKAGPYPFVKGDLELLTPSVAGGLGISVEETSLLINKLRSAMSEQDLADASFGGCEDLMPDWADWVPTTAAVI